MTAQINLAAAWIGISLGCTAGAVEGLLFHREAWLGGTARGGGECFGWGTSRQSASVC